jgi:hypothetical protein
MHHFTVMHVRAIMHEWRETMNTLRNGAQVIAVYKSEMNDRRTVLAQWEGPHPYVTWRLDDEGNTFLGHYFATLDEAVTDFKKRVQE